MITPYLSPNTNTHIDNQLPHLKRHSSLQLKYLPHPQPATRQCMMEEHYLNSKPLWASSTHHQATITTKATTYIMKSSPIRSHQWLILLVFLLSISRSKKGLKLLLWIHIISLKCILTKNTNTQNRIKMTIKKHMHLTPIPNLIKSSTNISTSRT